LKPLRVRETGKLTDPTSIESGEMSTLAWADIEEVLSEEWEIGGLAMTTETIRALIAGD
jgi:hypothetical protein